MSANEQPQAADGLPRRNLLRKVLETSHQNLIRASKMAQDGVPSMQSLQSTVDQATDLIRDCTARVVNKLQQPVNYRIEVPVRPVWVYILNVLLVVLFSVGLVRHFSAQTAGPAPQPEVAPRVDAAKNTTMTTSLQGQLPYSPDEVGVVTEVCFLVSRVSKQTARAPGAQTLNEFISAGVEYSSTPLQQLCEACQASQSMLATISESGDKHDRTTWYAAEAEERLQTIERAIILTNDPKSAAIYQRLFVDGLESESYHQTMTRMSSLCAQFWY